jgi:hypothetical protein
LLPFTGEFESRTTPSQEGEDDEDIQNTVSGPITRSRAKQLEKEMHDQVNANINLFNYNTFNESMLSSSCFNILRNDGVYESAWDEDNFSPTDLLLSNS